MSPMRAITAAMSLALAAGTVGAVTNLVVTHTGDGGDGSLRKALTTANGVDGAAAIVFDIPRSDAGFDAGTGVWTIRYHDTAPPVTAGNLVIDGHTQTAARGDTNPHGPEIAVCGNGHTVECPFLLLNVSNVTLRGFAINQFLYGIQIYGPGSHNNRVQANYVGIDPAGGVADGNFNGVELLSGAYSNFVGGSTAAERNVVSGNEHTGIRVSDADGNRIIGNYVGLDRTGASAVPNADGISIEGRSRGNVVGGTGPGERNVASGNTAYGIDLFGAGVQYNTIQGNYLGTDRTGSYAVPNTYGVLCDDRASLNLVGGLADGESNLISGNTAFGAYLFNNGTCSNIVQGNRIGTDVSGTAALPNETGVHIDGGSFDNTVDGNLISGNLVAGVTLFALYTDRNVITRNLIGVDIGGNQPLGNGADGVRIAFGPRQNLIGGSRGAANAIASNGKNGVSIESDAAIANRVSCNAIYANKHLGIDLFPEGVNRQHAAGAGSGPNVGINSPIILSVQRAGETSVVSGVANVVAPAATTVEVFGGEYNASGHVQGKTYLGSTTPHESGLWAFETQDAQSARTFAATLTDAAGNTSEFGQWTEGPLVVATAGPHGTITPSNAVLVWYEGSNFVSKADAYYSVAAILTNGLSFPVTSASVVTSVWRDANNGGTIEAEFAANLTVHDVPEWWLASHGLTNRDWAAEALDDQDEDGSRTWQEWQADTSPDDPKSRLRITGLNTSGDTVTVRWQGGRQAWQSLQAADGAVSNSVWTTIRELAPPTDPRNAVNDVASTNGVRFYRVRAARR